MGAAFVTVPAPFFHSSHASISHTRRLALRPSSSSSSAPVVEEESNSSPPPSDPEDASFKGCKACGKPEIEKGCNGEGRIQGGIATVPGFGWWPIKAYRPCPGFVASGGRYKRRGQSMDEVTSGGGGGPRTEPSSSKKKSSKG